MKKKLSLRTKTSLKTALRQRLLIGTAGLLVAVVVVSMLYLNFFTSENSKANVYEDGVIVQDLQLTSVCSENPNVSRRWRIRNLNDFDVAVEWDLYPYIQTGLLIAHPGDNFFYTNTISGANTTRIRWQDENQDWQQQVKASSGQACSSGGCFASEVISYTPTKRNDGSNIPEERRIASKALGAPEGDDAMNFVSLGFGGEIVLKFAQPFANGPGNDIRIVESTFSNLNCARYPEKIQAFVSQDGCHYVYVGEACQDAQFDLGPLSWAQYVKIKDISPVTHPFNGGLADGYDVDGVECLHGAAQNPGDDGLVAGSAQDVVQYTQGTRKNGTAVHPSRTNPQMALGVPQNDDMGINFTTLGFMGSMVLKFDYVVFNKPGNDLQVVETSFGQQSCSSYPEQAYFEGSLDGQTWYHMGEICLDGQLDMGDELYAMQYLRITDRSPATEFPNSADGYDVDGIVVLGYGCEQEARVVPFDRKDVPDEVAEVVASPNPFKDQFQIQYESGSLNEKVNLTVFNYVGQMVLKDQFTVPANTKISRPVAADGLPKGVYVVNLESSGVAHSIKVIKN